MRNNTRFRQTSSAATMLALDKANCTWCKYNTEYLQLIYPCTDLRQGRLVDHQ